MAEPMTESHPRKAMRVSPETQVLVKAGSLVTGAVSLVIATVFVWQIKTNSEQALAEQREFRREIAPALEKVQRLWWDYEQRTASRGGTSLGQP
jgi:hypothetical protein